MSKFIDKIKNAGLDKWVHGVACFAIAAIVALVCVGVFNDSNAVAGIIGWIVAVLIGVVKELVDFFRGGKADGEDLIADIIGATVAFCFAFLI